MKRMNRLLAVWTAWALLAAVIPWVGLPSAAASQTGFVTDEETGLTYYYNEDGTRNTEPRIFVDGKWCNFYPANSVVDGVNVSYSYLVGWKKMPGGITRYYPEGAYWYLTGFQSVDGKRYFFDKTSGALYVPKSLIQGMGWYAASGAYYALDPEDGGAWVYGMHANSAGETYYYKKYAGTAGYTTGLVTDNGNTYYFDPDTGKRVENETRVVGTATLTFDENCVLVKKVGLYEGYLYGEDGEPAAGQMMLCPDGMMYRATTAGKLDGYYMRTDPRDSSKKIYLLNGKVLEGLVTITAADLKQPSAKDFPEVNKVGVYLFEGNTKTYVKGFGTAPNGLEYFFRPANGTRYEPTGTWAQLTMVDGSKKIVNFYKKGTVVDGVDYSYVHKAGLVTENGNRYYYEDGTVGCVKGKTVTVDGVPYALDADTGVATEIQPELPPTGIISKELDVYQLLELTAVEQQGNTVYITVCNRSKRYETDQESSRFTYACTDVAGNTLSTGYLYFGRLRPGDSYTMPVTLPTGTTRLALTDLTVEYWTLFV